MSKKREDLRVCPKCMVLNALDSWRCYGCGQLLKNRKDLVELASQLCVYFNQAAENCGVSDCIEGCCLLCSDVRTCIFHCYQAERRM